MTKILTIDGCIDYASDLLKKGELVAFPTETVYGLGADAFNEKAVEKIFIAKGRPQDNPLIVHIAKIEDVNKVAKDIPPVFYEIANKFMPGPITVILNKKEEIPNTVTAGRNTVGVRLPENKIARKLIEESGVLIAAPSANTSKHISPTTAEHVYEDLNGKIPLIIDGGSCNVGIESTILDLTTEIPTILRPGAITKEMLSEILGNVEFFKGKVIKSAKAPGMKYKHYAPKVPALLLNNVQDIIAKYKEVVKNGQSPVIIGKNHVEFFMLNLIDIGKSGKDYAKNIYNALHIGEKNFDYIIVEELENTGVSYSVMNRIEKATKQEK